MVAWPAWIRSRMVRKRPADDPHWGSALAQAKPAATALAIAAFILGVTLDDLHLFRVPTIYPGAIAAVLIYAFAPPWFAVRALARISADGHHDPSGALDAARTLRRGLLAVAVMTLVVWLVLFSSGRTPRW